MPIVPSDEDLAAALTDLRGSNPSLGASKLHTKLLEAHTNWSVSEKRVKKSLAANNLVIQSPSSNSVSSNASDDALPIPKYRVIQNFNVSQYSPKIKVVDFKLPKGKGLVATAPISQGEELWTESPFVVAPDLDMYDLQVSSRACMHCMTPLSGNALQASIPCQYSKNSFTSGCTARFCNRLCLLRAQNLHPLLCHSANPGSVTLLAFARQRHWTALYAVIQCIARILLSNEQGRQQEVEEGLNFLSALPQISMEDRWKINGLKVTDQDQQVWKLSHTLVCNALCDPQNPKDKKQFNKILSKPIPEKLRERLFDYDFFMHSTAGMSLNLHYRGGLYFLHSHLNHSCQPSLSVSVAPPSSSSSTRSQPAKLIAVARRDIKPGEELTISYVNPDMPLQVRRRELKFWVIGCCRCPKCIREEKEANAASNETDKATNEKGQNSITTNTNGDELAGENKKTEDESTVTENGNSPTEVGDKFPDLAKELKEGLGLA